MHNIQWMDLEGPEMVKILLRIMRMFPDDYNIQKEDDAQYAIKSF